MPGFVERVGSDIDLAIIVVYLVAIMGFGAAFGRLTKTTSDFFVSGQRFASWLIAASYIATLVGSYSFMKYSEAAYEYGLASTSTYLNDWFLMPLFMFGWLPIIYFSRVMSVPEYFERRYGKATRIAGTAVILLYLIGYVGYNLYTIARALEPILGLDVMTIVLITAAFCGVYVTAGGQTSVIMTDLAQGLLLLLAGLGLLVVGIIQIGGFAEFWGALPPGHKAGMAAFNEPGKFSGVGLFWQDGMANSFAFYFMNQGIMLRFLAAKSAEEGRKAAKLIVLLLMPLVALSVSGAGWVGSAMAALGILPASTDPKTIFITVSNVICSPGWFGLVLAALTAALMSTIDTLINAIAAITVNDVYRPYLRPGAPDRHYLRVARIVTVASAAIGVGLVPLFLRSDSLYSAHANFTAAITPPIVVIILLGCTWRRFGGAAALWTIGLGGLAIFASILEPRLITPFAHGVDAGGYRFMRAFYGLVVCGAVALVAGFLCKRPAAAQLEGLTIWTTDAARRAFKGAARIVEPNGRKLHLGFVQDERAAAAAALHPGDLARLGALDGDLLYVCESRWWLGGLHSVHAKARADAAVRPGRVALSAASIASARLAAGRPVTVEVVI